MKKLLVLLSAIAFIAASFMSCSSPIQTTAVEIDSVKAGKGADYPEPKVADTPDQYEDDDTPERAKYDHFSHNDYKVHNFVDDPTDWVRIYVNSGFSYIIDTEVEGYADTVLELYATEADANAGTNAIAVNDDYNVKVGYASRIIFTAETDGSYFIKCKSYGNKTGSNRQYKLRYRWVAIMDNQNFNTSGDEGGWSHYADNGAIADMYNENSMELRIDEYNAGYNNYDIGVYKEDISVTFHGFYEIIFDIRTESGKTKDIELICGQSVSPWTTYDTSEVITVTDKMTTHKLFVDPRTYDNNAQLCFNLGGGTPMDFWMDNIIILRHYYSE